MTNKSTFNEEHFQKLQEQEKALQPKDQKEEKAQGKTEKPDSFPGIQTRNGKYVARSSEIIKGKSKTVFLGSFNTLSEAVRAKIDHMIELLHLFVEEMKVVSSSTETKATKKT